MEAFTIKGEYIELNKLLKASGLCDSGGFAKTVIDDGLVTVNGEVEYRKRCKIKPGQKIEFNGQVIEVR